MSERICPNCGKPALDFDRRQERGTFCSPLSSPDCWNVEQTYDHDLRHWVMTHEPGEPAPTAREMREARSAGSQVEPTGPPSASASGDE